MDFLLELAVGLPLAQFSLGKTHFNAPQFAVGPSPFLVLARPLLLTLARQGDGPDGPWAALVALDKSTVLRFTMKANPHPAKSIVPTSAMMRWMLGRV